MIKKKRASIMPYVLLIGVITASLVAMNTYVKRAAQARVKDLSDAMIGNQHLGQLSAGNSVNEKDTDSKHTRSEDKNSDIIKFDQDTRSGFSGTYPDTNK